MPLATPRQYAAMLDAAADGGYAYAAINVTSSETLNAALRGFKLANADGIVQISVGGAEYMSGTAAKDALLGARAFARYAHVVAEASPVLVALHTDHCPPSHVDDWLHPLLAESQRRVELGATPLFHSHMFDGSTLPLDENLRIASAILARCSELDVILEVESGVVGGEEDGIVGPANGRDELYTTPSDLLRVADALGIGERGRYLVAATFGNVHGTYAPGNVVLRPEILQAGQEAVAAAYPDARFQYVFHGSSGSSERELANAVSFGVCEGERRYRLPIRVHARARRPRARPLAGRPQSRRRDRGQAQLRPAGVGARRRGGDGRARPASLRAARVGRTQPRGLGVGQ